MNAKNSKTNSITAVLVVLLAILVGVNVFLLVNKSKQKKVINKQDEEIAYIDSLKNELTTEYNDAMAELDQMKGDNEELNAMIESQKEELARQKRKISSVISQGETNKEALEHARTMIADLQYRQNLFMGQLDSLEAVNVQLLTTTVQLKGEKKVLQEEVAAERVVTENLEKEKEVLIDEKEELTEKVDLASILKVRSIKGSGIKITKGGDEKEVARAKAADKLKVCFQVDQNLITEAGENYMLLRVVDPSGATLAVENLGSGTFTDSSGEEIRFTTFKHIDYQNESMDICLYWNPGTDFEKGEYSAYVYNQGYTVGEAKFALK